MSLFTIEFQVRDFGMLTEDRVHRLSADEIEYYSYTGDLVINSLGKRMDINDVPIIEVLQSIISLTRVFPMWNSKISFAHYFREASTGLEYSNSLIIMSHSENNSTDFPKYQEIEVDLPALHIGLGLAMRALIKELELSTPNVVTFIKENEELSRRFPFVILAAQNTLV